MWTVLNKQNVPNSKVPTDVIVTRDTPEMEKLALVSCLSVKILLLNSISKIV